MLERKALRETSKKNHEGKHLEKDKDNSSKGIGALGTEEPEEQRSIGTCEPRSPRSLRSIGASGAFEL